jgi:hypothetical protein
MEITVLYRQSGSFWTAAAFIGESCAGIACCSDKALAGQQARAYAETLAAAGPLQPLDSAAARLGAPAKLSAPTKLAGPGFGLYVSARTSWRAAVVQAAQLAALDVPHQVQPTTFDVAA